MVSESPAGFVPAKITDDGRTRMDPRAYATLRSYQVESGMKDDDVPALLHAFVAPFIEDLERVAGVLEGLDERMKGISRKRGSFEMVLRVRVDDLEKIENLMLRIKTAAASLRGDGKALIQVFLIVEGEK